MAAEYCSAEESQNKANVIKLYKALAAGDTQMVAGVVAGDLEWWFHGPPRCQHMMRVLTGESPAYEEFKFEPRSITAIDEECVIAEGWEGAHAYWVHVWTLKGGRITQFREYFNTWLTVKDVRPADWEVRHRHRQESPTPTLWQSQQPRDLFKRSLPGLLLAI